MPDGRIEVQDPEMIPYITKGLPSNNDSGASIASGPATTP
jgi:hypothetical protein